MADNNALVKLEESTRGLITDVATLTTRIREWQQHAHVLAPVVQSLPPQYAASATLVVLDTALDRKGMGGEIYSVPADGRGVPWLSAGEAAVGKVGLRRISQAAGITWDPTIGRVDDGKERYYWSFKAVGWYIGCDGSRQNISASYELDLRDGSPSLKGFTEPQIIQARKNGMRLCESKAMNAAIRELGIRQKYQLTDLQKPFVVVRVAFVADMKDPVQRRLVAERGLAGSAALYPNRQIGAGHDPDTIDVQAERIETVQPTNGGGAAAPSTEKVNTATGEIVETASAEPTGPTITAVEVQTGKTRDQVDAQGKVIRKGGRDFTRYFITLSDERKLYTFDAEVGKLAEQLRDAKAPVDVNDQETRFGREIIELVRAQAQLPLDGPTDADLGVKL